MGTDRQSFDLNGCKRDPASLAGCCRAPRILGTLAFPWFFRTIFCLIVMVIGPGAFADTTSSISANFNGTAITGGDTVWFTSVTKVSGLGSSPVTIYVRKSTISFTASGTPYTVAAPDSNVTFNPSATSATISFDSTKNLWQITVPLSGLAGNVLLGAAQFAVPAGGLPGGIQNVKWQANFSASASGISLQWQWAAAVYTSFSTNYGSLGVKPVDDNKASQYQNSDHAGTPENYKTYVTGGATGGGGSNYTGSYSGTVSVTVPVVQAPTASVGGPYSAYVSKAIAFNGSGSTDPDGYALNYSWNFGDGATATGATPSHSYSSAGTFTVTLTVDDGRSVTGTSSTTATLTLPPPPVITATITPSPNAAGWNNSSVTVSFTCADANVGIKTCPPPVAVTAQGANQPVSGTATDNAGVTATTTMKVSIDETAPTISATLSPAPDSAGWNNTNVTVSFICSDSLSGIAQCPQPILVSASGANQVVSGTATDAAGNTASTSATLNVELTLPSIAASASPTANAQGWNNSNVTVSFTCTKSVSPLTGCSASQTITAEGANQVVSGTVTDAANNSNTAKITLSIAKTPPTISASLAPAPNGNGWNNSAVTVNFTCKQTTAPLATCPQAQTVSKEGANQTVMGTVADVAGNSASTTAQISIATTPPTITASVSPQPNAAGWNNAPATVTFTCTATTAPIASCPAAQTVSTEGANQVVSGTVADVAGNTATAKVTLNIALTPPKITATPTPAPDSAGWNNSAVTVSFTCTNTTAPIASCPQAQTISTEGANQTVTGTVTDVAGNSAAATVTLNIGTKPPVIIASTSPGPNAAGWNNVNVTVGFACTAGTAPIAKCSSPVTVTSEGANQSIPGVASDLAGNTATAVAVLNIDKTPPSISYTLSPPPNASGVNTTTPVTITFSCSDALSGIASCASPISVTTVGMGQVFNVSATDRAGNTATLSVTVNIQPVPPTISAAVSPSPNAKGWFNSNPTVTFSCSPGSYPISSCTAPVVVSTEGANQPVCGQAVDSSGQTASACATVSLDKTPPTITATTSPAAGSNGWNTTPVTVTFTCSDSLSGVATCPAQKTLSSDGANQSVSGTAADTAGNSGSTQVTVNIDQEPPSILQFVAPTQLAPGQSGTATVTATDSVAVSSVVFQLSGATLATLVGPPYSTSFTAPSTATDGQTLTLTAIVTNVAGISTSSSRGFQIVPAGVVTGQVLYDATGLPLSGATVQILGGSGQATSDANGIYSIPANTAHFFLSAAMAANASAGAPNMVTVEREVFLQNGVGTVPVDARMTAVATGTSVNSSGGTLTSGTLSLTIAAGAVSSPTTFHLTPLSQQGLPGLLPLGWSPVGAFDLRSDSSTSATFSAAFTQVPSSLTLHFVRYDYNTHSWLMVTPNLSAANGRLTIPVPFVGDFVLVTADVGSSAPTIPSAGQPLTGVAMVTLAAGAAAAGSLNPPSVSPMGGTSTATLAVQSSVPLPSGTVIQANVQETYTLTTGKQLSDPRRTEDILLYQYSAPSGSAAVASFPVTPSLTFSPEQLASGDVHLDILTGRESIRGQVGGSDAASVTAGNATLTVAAGSLPQDTAISVAPEATDTFLPSTSTLLPLAEYNIDLSGQILLSPAQLSVAPGNAKPGDTVVLAQIQRIQGVPYLVVVSLAQVNGANLVTQATPGFSGITQGGDYVFYKLASPTGFVSGTVTASTGPVPALIQTDGLPFVAFASSAGSYVIIAAAGSVNLTASVPNTAVSGNATTQVTAAQTAAANITVTGQTETATVTPPNGAVGVPLTAEIDITTPDPLNRASATATSVTLTQIGQGTNTPVPVRFVFTQGDTRLSVFPVSALQPSTMYTMSASALANTLGGLVSVPTTTFTTQANTPLNFNTDALVFAMPDQNGNVAISAPANSFPPATMILIVDQTNGVVLSLTVANDGSVSGQMPATIDDVLAVTITAPDKTTASFTRSKFVAPDGTTAIGPGGGTITGPGNTGLIIPLGALNKGATFKLDLLDQTAFPQLPNWQGANFGSGIKITAPAMPSFNKEAKLAFPVPANAPQGAFYYVYRRLVDVNNPNNILFETIDHAFVQGTGANVQVVTASPPFCGLMNFFGNFQAVAAASYQPLQTAITFTFMMWDFDPNQAGVASQGLIAGRVFQNDALGNAGPLQPSGSVATIASTNNPQYVTTTSPACGTYSLFDPLVGGGPRSLTATATLPTFDPSTGQTTIQTQKIVDTADEVNGVQPNDNLFSVVASLYNQYRNIGRLNFTFAPATPPPPPPQINISILAPNPNNNNTLASISGIVQTGTALTIKFSSTLSIEGVTINGVPFSAVVPDSPPANPSPGYMYTALKDTYPAGTPGLYTIVATAVNPLDPSTPVNVSRSFLVVAQGGSNTFATANQAPVVIGAVPSPNAQSVSTAVFPQFTFSEPVSNVPGNVALIGSPSGDSPALLLIGIKADGSIANPLRAGDAITSLTIQPLTGLEFSETYTLTLNKGILGLGKDSGGNPIPLATYTLQFTTFGPRQLGSTSSQYEVITRPVVIGQMAYAGEFLSTVTSGLGMFDISDPSNPVDKNIGASFIGRAIDITALEQSPVTGGPLVAISAAPSQAVTLPGNVWLYSVPSTPQQLQTQPPTRVGGVSVTSSATQGGIPTRLAMKDNYLYTFTYRQGLQVVDLNQVVQEYQSVTPTQFGQAMSTEGNGFALDAVVNTIPLTNSSGGTFTMWDLKTDDFITSNSSNTGATQTLLAAAGQLPLVLADPTQGGPQAVVYPPSVGGKIADNPVQGMLLTLANGQNVVFCYGRSVALGAIPVTDNSGNTISQHVAAVIGSGLIGTVTTCPVPGATSAPPSVPMLVVVDLTGAYVQGATGACNPNATMGSPNCPKMIGFVQLPTSGTDVKLNGSVALVATGTNILLVNLANPAQPALAGQITGTFGNWLAVTGSGLILDTGMTGAAIRSETMARSASIKRITPTALISNPQGQVVTAQDVEIDFGLIPPGPTIRSATVNIYRQRANETQPSLIQTLPTLLNGGDGTAIWPAGRPAERQTRYFAQALVTADQDYLTSKVAIPIVAPVDLEVDSDNNDGFNLPDGADAEKNIKDDPGRPGKYVLVNDNDDNLNRVPDFAEFSNPNDQFVPVVLKVVSGLNLNAVQFRFQYDASDPAAVQPPGGTALEPVYTVPSGHLRLWKRDANGVSKPARSPQSSINSGDFIPANTPLTAAQLGLTQDNLQVVFDLEAVQPSAAPGDQRIVVEIDPDGIGPLPFEFGDAVRVTAVQVQLKDRVFTPPKSIIGGQISWVGNDTTKPPLMPDLIAQIVPDISQSAGARAQWYLRAEFQKPNANPALDELNYVPPTPAGATAAVYQETDVQSPWDITAAIQNVPREVGFFGGEIELHVNVPGRFAHTLQFKIRGRNPDEAVAQAYIRGMTDGVNTAPWYADAIARHESRPGARTRYYNQFNEFGTPNAGLEGTPNWGYPSGWGIFQLEIEQRSNLPLRTLHRWNWQENANLALTLLTQNATRAATYLARQQAIAQQQMGTAQPIPDNLGSVGNCNFLGRNPQSAHTFADAVAIGMWNGGPNYHFVEWSQQSRMWVVHPYTVWHDQQGGVHHNLYVQAVCQEVQ